MTRMELWDFFSQDHKLTLLDSELADIIDNVEKYLATEKYAQLTPFFAIKDPEGLINHMTMRTEPEEAVEEFLDDELAMNLIANCGRFERGEQRVSEKTWEQWQAEGYSVVPVRMLEFKE